MAATKWLVKYSHKCKRNTDLVPPQDGPRIDLAEEDHFLLDDDPFAFGDNLWDNIVDDDIFLGQALYRQLLGNDMLRVKPTLTDDLLDNGNARKQRPTIESYKNSMYILNWLLQQEENKQPQRQQEQPIEKHRGGSHLPRRPPPLQKIRCVVPLPNGVLSLFGCTGFDNAPELQRQANETVEAYKNRMFFLADQVETRGDGNRAMELCFRLCLLRWLSQKLDRDSYASCLRRLAGGLSNDGESLNRAFFWKGGLVGKYRGHVRSGANELQEGQGKGPPHVEDCFGQWSSQGGSKHC